MIAALEIAYTAGLTAATLSGGYLEGVKTILEGPYDRSIQAGQYPAIEVLFIGGTPGVDVGIPGVVNWTGTHYLRMFVQSMANLTTAKRQLLRLLWSDDGTKGLIPFLAHNSSVTVGQQAFIIRPGRTTFRFSGGDGGGSTYAVEIPLTIQSMFG